MVSSTTKTTQLISDIPLLRCAQDEIPPNIALMQLIFQCNTKSEVEDAVSQAVEIAKESLTEGAGDRVEAVRALLQANPSAFEVIKAMAATIDEEGGFDAVASSTQTAIAIWRKFYDRAVAIAPETSVVGYALGDTELYKEITARVVTCLDQWNILGKHRRVLDFGCGIGRLGKALSDRCREVFGVDISSEMLKVASKRCADIRNVHFRQIGGLDLADFQDESFDVIIAVDVIPHIMTHHASVAQQLVHEFIRVLRKGGDLVILGYSWRNNVEQDRREISDLAHRLGLQVIRNGTRDIDLWDGFSFHLWKCNSEA